MDTISVDLRTGGSTTCGSGRSRVGRLESITWTTRNAGTFGSAGTLTISQTNRCVGSGGGGGGGGGP